MLRPLASISFQTSPKEAPKQLFTTIQLTSIWPVPRQVPHSASTKYCSGTDSPSIELAKARNLPITAQWWITRGYSNVGLYLQKHVPSQMDSMYSLWTHPAGTTPWKCRQLDIPCQFFMHHCTLPSAAGIQDLGIKGRRHRKQAHTFQQELTVNRNPQSSQRGFH